MFDALASSDAGLGSALSLILVEPVASLQALVAAVNNVMPMSDRLAYAAGWWTRQERARAIGRVDCIGWTPGCSLAAIRPKSPFRCGDQLLNAMRPDRQEAVEHIQQG